MCLMQLDQNIVHQNSYQDFDADKLAEYDKTIQNYYASRSTNNKSVTWSKQIQAFFSKDIRPFMRDVLNKRGFNQR